MTSLTTLSHVDSNLGSEKLTFRFRSLFPLEQTILLIWTAVTTTLNCTATNGKTFQTLVRDTINFFFRITHLKCLILLITELFLLRYMVILLLFNHHTPRKSWIYSLQWRLSTLHLRGKQVFRWLTTYIWIHWLLLNN